MKKIIALSLVMLIFVTPAKAIEIKIDEAIRISKVQKQRIENAIIGAGVETGIRAVKKTIHAGIRGTEKIIDYFTKTEKEKLWTKLQRQIVKIDKQVEIQNQAADKLDEHGHCDDLEANEEYEYKYNTETIKYWERRKNAATTAILYNELVGDKDNLEREKGYLSEAKRNIELLSDKLTDENTRLELQPEGFIYRHGVGFIALAITVKLLGIAIGKCRTLL
jgi:hypothetical protein